MALKGLESFPMPVDKISRTATTVIRHLSKEFPSERLGNGRNGVNDIKRHKWFQVCFKFQTKIILKIRSVRLNIYVKIFYRDLTGMG